VSNIFTYLLLHLFSTSIETCKNKTKLLRISKTTYMWMVFTINKGCKNDISIGIRRIYLFCTFFYFAFLICVYSQNISLANVFSHLVVVISAPLCPDNCHLRKVPSLYNMFAIVTLLKNTAMFIIKRHK
jgi:hypothetical protein